ncbi:MAG: MFS transporter [Acidimicrobiales bacterium]
MTNPGELAAHPRRVVLGLSLGHGGMSVLINLIAILLVYFYLPPTSAGLPPLVTDATFLFVLNAIVVIAAAGRLLDAVTDPLIAVASDRSTHALGRRIPFMRIEAIPAALATILLFVPPVRDVSGWNILWLLGVQAVLYLALTAYVTPAFSLVADLGRTPSERLDLATWTSVAWAVGIMVAALSPFISAMYQRVGLEPIRAWQGSVVTVVGVALACMWAPIRMIDEPSLVRSTPSAVPIRQALRLVFSNPFFRYYLAADFAFFSGLTIIQTGLLYYVTVLLELDETLTAPLLLLMVVVSMFLYPIVNRQAKLRSGKQLVVFAFVVSAVDFVGVVFLGRSPLPNWAEAVLLILLFAVPFAILSVIPQWILSDIAEHAAVTTGQATAATFFAARTFMQKLGQTIGVMVFALLAAFGRDVGDDLGIRLSGLAGMILYLVAALLFRHYDEATMQRQLAEAADHPTVTV